VPVGELILYVDSDDRLALAASNANAARKLGVEDGDILVLRRLRKRPA
jgi:S-adenosylmethionine hydrolase